VGVFLVAREGGSPRLHTFLNRFSERVDSELRVDGSSYMIPSAIDSSNHAEDVNPSLICILCHEDGFQDFFVQAYGCADFRRKCRFPFRPGHPVLIHRGCTPGPVDMSRGVFR